MSKIISKELIDCTTSIIQSFRCVSIVFLVFDRLLINLELIE